MSELKWRPGTQNPDEPLAILAVDSLGGTFSASLANIEGEEPDEDEIADSFKRYLDEYVPNKLANDRKMASQGRSPTMTELDLQHSVPVDQQIKSLEKSPQEDTSVKHTVSFSRVLDQKISTTGGFSRTFDVGNLDPSSIKDPKVSPEMTPELMSEKDSEKKLQESDATMSASRQQGQQNAPRQQGQQNPQQNPPRASQSQRPPQGQQSQQPPDTQEGQKMQGSNPAGQHPQAQSNDPNKVRT